MVRLQIQLQPSQHRAVRQRAQRLGVSTSEIIRRCVQAQLAADDVAAPDGRTRRARAIAGKYREPSGVRDLAARHDAVLAAAYRR